MSYRKISTPDKLFYKIKNEIVKYTGSIKLHGSSVSVIFDGENIYTDYKKSMDSRFAFPLFLKMRESQFRILFKKLNIDKDSMCIIFGEYCGSNIQPFNIAIAKMPIMFVIFDVKIISKNSFYNCEKFDENEIKKTDFINIENLNDFSFPEYQIYNINYFPKYEVTIDFSSEESLEIARKKIEDITKKVENECPFAKTFNIIGKGEGVVWKAWKDDGTYEMFKTKGEEHKVKVEKSLVCFKCVKVENLDLFINIFLTNNRIEQIKQKFFEKNQRNSEIKDIQELTNQILKDIFEEEKWRKDVYDIMTVNPKEIFDCVKKYLIAKF